MIETPPTDDETTTWDEGPESWIEARLDLLLAQECSADLDFARWLASRAGVERPDRVTVESTCADISVFEEDDRIPDAAIEETDVRLTLSWSNGSTDVVLIENKVWAEFQPRQMERYRMRCDAIGARCLLIAPSVYLDRARRDAEHAHGAVSVEEIIEQIGARESRHSAWTGEYLKKLIEPKERKVGISDLDTVAFTEHCIEWCATNAPDLVPQRSSLHTLGQGWLYFETRPELIYKVVGLKAEAEAFVDLYLGRKTDDGLVRGSAGPIDAFVYDVDTADNLLLRHRCPKLDPHDGRPATDDALEAVADALDACRRAFELVRSAEWLEIATVEAG
jgi:hypothetical protein